MGLTDMIFSGFNLKLLLAFLLGGILGFERQRHGRAAGLRTHILVCLASNILMIITIYLGEKTDVIKTYQLDPSRLAAGVMTGMGFIGAGTIMKSQNYIRGLTTAASVWLTASIGIVIGLGYIQLAVSTTFIALFVLLVLGKVDSIIRTETFHILMVKLHGSDHILPEIKSLCLQRKAKIDDINIYRSKISEKTIYKLQLKFPRKIDHESLVNQILEYDNVEKVSWKSY